MTLQYMPSTYVTMKRHHIVRSGWSKFITNNIRINLKLKNLPIAKLTSWERILEHDTCIGNIVQIAAASNYCLLLDSNGTVWKCFVDKITLYYGEEKPQFEPIPFIDHA